MQQTREFQAGPLLAAAGGLLLVVSLFLDWYDVFSAWTIFEVLDLLLAALAISAIVAAASGFGFPRWVPARALPAIGAAAFVIVASQLVNHPPAGTDREIEIGGWLALVGSLAMLVGGVISVARVSLAVNVSDRPAHGEGAPPAAPAAPAAPGDSPPAAGTSTPPGDAPPPSGTSTPPPPPAAEPAPPPSPGPDDPTHRL